MSIKIDGISEFAAENNLPAGKWFELRIRFCRNADGTVDTVVARGVVQVPESELEIMRGRKGGQLS